MASRFPILPALVAVLAACGCRTAGPIPQPGTLREGVPTEHIATVAFESDEVADSVFDRPGRRDFQQVDLTRRSGQGRPYPRETNPEGRIEGSLIGRIEFPLSDYLDPHSKGGNRKLVWPSSPAKQVDAFFIELKPPVMEWPRQAVEGDVSEAKAQMIIYDRDGVPFLNGTAHRTVRATGFGAVESGGQQWEGVVQMEAQTELSFGWVASIRMSETAWFAPGVGLVRRNEQFSGRALWLFRFHGSSQYDAAPETVLTEAATEPEESDDVNASSSSAAENELDASSRSALAGDRLWSRLAVCLERTGRRIRVSGLAVEWEVQTPALAIAK